MYEVKKYLYVKLRMIFLKLATNYHEKGLHVYRYILTKFHRDDQSNINFLLQLEFHFGYMPLLKG